MFEHFQDGQDNTFVLAATEEITATLIEKIVKKFKTHHAVIDFDNKFVTATVKMEEELSSEVNENIVPPNNYY